MITGWLDRGVRGADRALLQVAPPQRLAVVRILVGLFVATTAAGLLPSTLNTHHLPGSAYEPVGILAFADARPSWLVMLVVNVLAVATGLAMAAGWRHAVTGPVAAFAFLLTATHRSSFGMIFHSENLLALHALVLAFAPAADALSLDARGRPVPSPSNRYGWPLAALAVLTVAAYFMAGVAKLRAEGISWAAGEFLRNQIAFDNVRKAELGAFHSTLGARLLASPQMFAPLASLSLALEALAPLFLFSWRALRLWALGIIAFHVGILLLMAVAFPYPLTGAAFAAFFPLERVVERLSARQRPDVNDRACDRAG